MAIKTVEGIVLLDANQNETGSRFFVGDKVTITVKDLTTTTGIRIYNGRIDAVHRVDGKVRLDASTEFVSSVLTFGFDDITAITAYVAPTTDTVTTATPTATVTVATGTTGA